MGSTSPSDNVREHAFAVNLMQHLVVPTFVLDRDRRVIIWNRACERLTGVPAADVLGTSRHWTAFYSKPRLCLADVLALGKTDELESLYAFHTEPGEHGYGLRAENWCVMPKVGSHLYLAIDAGPIYDESGELIAVVETLRDMTEHKNAQLALQQLAACDGLTGIPNRRSFDEKLAAEWNRALRQGDPLSLILADVDQFKRYNDHFGHQVGDECLTTVAGVLSKQIYRAGDMPARYGGEEFAVILPCTDLSGAGIVAERLRCEVENLAIPHPASGVTAVITLSLGVATFTPRAEILPQALIAQADSALYAAKNNGRNQVFLAKDSAQVALAS